jgi:hypothetical protein
MTDNLAITIIEPILRDNIKLKDELEKVRCELEKANDEIKNLKERLKKYTAPARKKKYYDAHRDEILEKAKNNEKKYVYTETKEQRQEYNKRYYLKKKEAENEIDTKLE